MINTGGSVRISVDSSRLEKRNAKQFEGLLPSGLGSEPTQRPSDAHVADPDTLLCQMTCDQPGAVALRLQGHHHFDSLGISDQIALTVALDRAPVQC